MSRPVRVLVIDDSALVRSLLQQGLGLDPGIEVVGTAADPYEARDRIVQLLPDVLTLDVEMPRMNGVEFLRRLMPQHPLPTIMVSSLTEKGKATTLEALEAGAVDFVAKPSADVARGLQQMMTALRTKVKIAATARVSHWKGRTVEGRKPGQAPSPGAMSDSTDKVIAIGASTGGTEALKAVLSEFPASMPGTVIVQHMPAGFTKMFADRLNQLCRVEVKEAVTGDRVGPGRVLIAPGDRHLRVIRSGGFYQAVCESGEAVSGHCPSVDVLMHSVSKAAGRHALGVMLTGMGSDGADGLGAMRQAGARTLAQDEASSIVFGMPKVAFERGGAEKLVPLDGIARNISRLLAEQRS
ncbi:chemotaxis response regulator protein-glutamate methylesterase [Desulfuromonas sp.]|uniref:protein-glutamate methylesterase/protein-glutamine glutaminase n=1 Tax=Desulfuromonas sp. TaxID=892 RepID=UPI0025BB5353|nr:chemotaxis response regulator protein-glutamate methylesterase [Desulfuromonas sp.]